MTTKLPFAILVQGDHPARDIPRPIFDISELSDDDLLGMCKPAGGVLVIDLETQGTESWDFSRHVVGFSVADAEGCCYVHLGIGTENQARWRIFLEMLYTEGTPLLAHNQQFDAAWMSRDLSLNLEPDNLTFDSGVPWHVWHGCTLSMYKNLASEGWMGQRHGLAHAMVDVLGWNHIKGEEVAEWLCEHGYVSRDIPKWLVEKLTKE